MHRRLILFFSLLVIGIILSFSLLLIIFGITGSGHQAIQHYLESELTHISQEINSDFGNLSVTGLSLARTLAEDADSFFMQNNLEADQLSNHPEYIEQLLSIQMSTLISVAENNSCGGVFVILDATVSPKAEHTETKKAGIFLKKTQPVTSSALGAKEYWLRGPASIAREHGIELMGQWIMEYDISEIPFFHTVLETTKKYPDVSLSRLYYWSDSLRLIGNSEDGILLCVPLRSQNGVVYGVCGIEVSEQMFKLLYSPSDGAYFNIFTLLSPCGESILYAGRGLYAGNTYLTKNQLKENLIFARKEQAFSIYAGEQNSYGGSVTSLSLYPAESPYKGDSWCIAVLLSENSLVNAIKGNSIYFYLIIAGLIFISLIGSFFISKKYLQPIKKGLASIQEKAYEKNVPEIGLMEIDNLFESLARDMREHREEMEHLTNDVKVHQAEMERLTNDARDHQEEMERLISEKQCVQNKYEKAQRKIERLSFSLKEDIDPEDYQHVADSLHTLTQTERKIFEYYFAGKTTKEIILLMEIKESTLKFHNTNIYEKLGVKNRKELLQYATLIQHEKEKK
ncbi:MAG: hypothetical protein IJP31_00420 [Lachnospiraceae bacterium]|nr:hypothetical protein [Lachnospiraceae bacterium]